MHIHICAQSNIHAYVYFSLKDWEAGVDTHGRVFYIDHVNRTTTWQKPQVGQSTGHRRPTISSEQRQQLDRR